MPARTPEELLQRIAETFSAHDVEGAVELYEPNATLVAQPGQVVTGTEAIREVLSGLLGMRPRFDLKVSKAFQADDTALIFSDWTLSATDPDGNAVEMAGQGSDVARRQADGSWLMMIDNPWGGEHGFI
jgi:uncharacterized protein (TIGR02246 family)